MLLHLPLRILTWNYYYPFVDSIQMQMCACATIKNIILLKNAFFAGWNNRLLIDEGTSIRCHSQSMLDLYTSHAFHSSVCLYGQKKHKPTLSRIISMFTVHMLHMHTHIASCLCVFAMQNVEYVAQKYIYADEWYFFWL